MKKILVIIILSIIIILVSLYFFRDYFEYLEVIEQRDPKLYEEFYKKYPNSIFTEDVKYHELLLSNNIEKVREFLLKYPNSKYLDEVKRSNYNIWNEEINKYIKRIRNTPGADPKAVKFFITLMYYLRDNYSKTIYLNLRGNVNLREFNEYPENSRKALLKDITRDETAHPFKNNLISIKDIFKIGQIENLENIIRGGLKKSFENVLSANFIEVSTKKLQNTPDLHIDVYYQIKNEEREINKIMTPALWEYWNYNQFETYFLGIAIDFNFNFQIPKSSENYNFKHTTYPGDYVKNIKNLNLGYILMTKKTFENFAEDIIKLFGLRKYNYKYSKL